MNLSTPLPQINFEDGRRQATTIMERSTSTLKRGHEGKRSNIEAGSPREGRAETMKPMDMSLAKSAGDGGQRGDLR